MAQSLSGGQDIGSADGAFEIGDTGRGSITPASSFPSSSIMENEDSSSTVSRDESFDQNQKQFSDKNYPDSYNPVQSIAEEWSSLFLQKKSIRLEMRI